mmetsp:Transcript_34856/g.87687  ORF Transcript_34856/g.87687 Transcript_34856/m.87687 type:complete len:209 (-) Transcript_34856:566-1192(-)
MQPVRVSSWTNKVTVHIDIRRVHMAIICPCRPCWLAGWLGSVVGRVMVEAKEVHRPFHSTRLLCRECGQAFACNRNHIGGVCTEHERIGEPCKLEDHRTVCCGFILRGGAQRLCMVHIQHHADTAALACLVLSTVHVHRLSVRQQHVVGRQVWLHCGVASKASATIGASAGRVHACAVAHPAESPRLIKSEPHAHTVAKFVKNKVGIV